MIGLILMPDRYLDKVESVEICVNNNVAVIVILLSCSELGRHRPIVRRRAGEGREGEQEKAWACGPEVGLGRKPARVEVI